MSKGQRQQSYETFKKNTIIQFWKITRKRYGNKSPFDKFLLKKNCSSNFSSRFCQRHHCLPCCLESLIGLHLKKRVHKHTHPVVTNMTMDTSDTSMTSMIHPAFSKAGQVYSHQQHISSLMHCHSHELSCSNGLGYLTSKPGTNDQ